MRLKSRHRASLLPSRLPLTRVQRLKQRAMTTMRASQDAREPGALRRPGVSTRRTNNGSEHEGKPTSAAGAAASADRSSRCRLGSLSRLLSPSLRHELTHCAASAFLICAYNRGACRCGRPHPPPRRHQIRSDTGEMGGGVWRVAGEPLADADPPFHQRTVRPLRRRRRGLSGGHRKPDGVLRRVRVPRRARIVGKALRADRARRRQASRCDRADDPRVRGRRSDYRRHSARGGEAGGASAPWRTDRRPCARSGEPRSGAKARRLPAPCADSGLARHPPAVDGAILARNAGADG